MSSFSDSSAMFIALALFEMLAVKETWQLDDNEKHEFDDEPLLFVIVIFSSSSKFRMVLHNSDSFMLAIDDRESLRDGADSDGNIAMS